MTTIDSLLEELGTPPRDICLDWAWQIQQLCNAQNPAADSFHLPLTWENLELNEAGQLKLICGNSKSLSPDELLQQLVSWSARYAQPLSEFDTSPSASPTTSPSDISSRLQALTLAAFDDEVAESKNAIIATSTPQLAARSESPNKVTSVRKLPSDRKPGDLSRAPVGRKDTSGRKKFSPETRHRNRRLAILVISVAAIIPIAFCVSSILKVDHNVTETAHSQTPSRALSSPLISERSVTQPTVIPNRRNATQDSSPISPSELSMSSSYGKALEPGVIEGSNVQETNGQRLLSGVDLDLPQTIANIPNADMDMAASVENLLARAPEMPGSDSENELTSTGRSQNELAKSEMLATDVMAELASARNSAEGLNSESEFVTSEETNGNISEPLLINTTPAVQIQKLPAKLATRPRQPVWRMAIAVDDGFTVSPSEPQLLTERELATWIITSDDAQPPRTRLSVQVQMSSGRQAALKWQISAGTDDFPNLSLPLGEKILQPLQERLRQFTSMALQETERLKLLATSGVPSDLRTAISRQRASIEAEGKLASRLLTFVASAQQLDDWLHGHVAVFAELRDGTAPDATLVLRFGDLTDLARTEASEDSQKQSDIGNPEQDE